MDNDTKNVWFPLNGQELVSVDCTLLLGWLESSSEIDCGPKQTLNLGKLECDTVCMDVFLTGAVIWGCPDGRNGGSS